MQDACSLSVRLLLAQQVNPQIVWIVAAAAVVVFLLGVIVAFARRRAKPPAVEQPDLTINVPALPEQGPPPEGPALLVYGTPVRLAALILAPVGREGVLPPQSELEALIDHITPGLMRVLASHQPLFRKWPPQLSSQGFTHAFYQHAALPGDRGKGTPWCSVAGKYEEAGQQFLIGMVCCGHKPNGLGEINIEHEGKWLEVLRVSEG